MAGSPTLEESNLRKEGSDPRTVGTWKGTTRTPGCHPEETASQLPLVSGKRYSQISVGCLSAQRRGGEEQGGARHGVKWLAVSFVVARLRCIRYSSFSTLPRPYFVGVESLLHPRGLV